MACTNEEIHLFDIGTIFDIELKDCDVAVDVSTATTKEILFKKPNTATITKPAEFITDGTDGRIKYTTIADDLDTLGTWVVQARVVLSSGTWSSSKAKFKVYDNL